MKKDMQKSTFVKNILDGSLSKNILLFALPLAFTGILQQLFNAADIAVVGQFTGELGAQCMAAVGACAPLINLLVNLFIGISLGSNVVIANMTGNRNEKGSSRAAKTSVIIALIGGFFIAIVGQLITPALMRWMSVPDEVFGMAMEYMRIYLIGMPVILLYNFCAAIFRGIGNTRLPLLTLSFAGIVNVALNLFLVAVLHLNVAGVAIATITSNAISSVLLIYLLFKKTKLMSMDYGSFVLILNWLNGS